MDAKCSIVTFSGQASEDVDHSVLGSQCNLYLLRVYPRTTHKPPFKEVPQGLHHVSQLTVSSLDLLTQSVET